MPQRKEMHLNKIRADAKQISSTEQYVELSNENNYFRQYHVNMRIIINHRRRDRIRYAISFSITHQ